MCLEVLLPVDTYEEQGTGFKVFIENEFRTLEGVYRGLYQGLFCYKIGMEYNATECTLFDSYDQRYMSGFHIFVNLESAIAMFDFFKIKYPKKKCVIVKVSYKERTSCGKEYRKNEEQHVIVARYMTLESIVEIGDYLWKRHAI